MKLALESKNNPINGYVNINNQPYQIKDLPEGTTIIPGHYNNLDPVCKNSTVEEIIFFMPLNVMDPNNLIKIVNHWKDKLITGGIIQFFFVEIEKVCLLGYNGSISLEELHKLLLGNDGEHKCILNFSTIRELIKALGMTILSVDTNSHLSSIRILK